MGNNESRENDQSVRIVNETQIPLKYSIDQAGPLYWGTIQPGERITRQTGRVWFTVRFWPAAAGSDDYYPPSTDDICARAIYPLEKGGRLPEIIDLGNLHDWVKSEGRGARLDNWRDGAKTVQYDNRDWFVKGNFYDAVGRAFGMVERRNHYANGDWVYARGGAGNGQPYAQWSSMRIGT